jgi:hypothetical protein
MSPLSIDVWIYILTAYLAVSLILYTISRLENHCIAVQGRSSLNFLLLKGRLVHADLPNSVQ